MGRRQLSEELTRYGYVFSLKKSVLLYAAAMMAAVVLGLYFGLRGGYLLALGIWIVFWLPFLLRNNYKNRYEQRRFSDANIYIEQFLYSFQKSGKILATLQDVAQLFEGGEMCRQIEAAIDCILHTYDRTDVEKKGLELIERRYPAPQISSMHRFALQVEKNGGDYHDGILLLLDSRRLWADRVYALLKEKKKKRFQILLSIATSLFLCSMIFLVSDRLEVSLKDSPVTMTVTLVVLMLDFWIFYLADKRLSVGYFCEEEDDGEILEQYCRITGPHKGWLDSLGRRIGRRRVTRELEKVFPRWLMDVSLLLQSENVQVAIFKSYQDAPRLMQPELKKLIVALQDNPASMEPYRNFFREFPLPEVQSAMKMLYSLSEGTGGNAAPQIADLIRRNQILMDKGEKMKNEDALAGMYALFLTPQLTGGFKMLVDLVIALGLYMGNMGGIV